MKSPDMGIHKGCGEKIQVNANQNENVACLINGSETDIEDFANNITSKGYLEHDLNLSTKEAEDLILFLQKLNAPSYLLNKKEK